MSPPKIFQQLPEPGSLLQRTEVFSLNVFYQCLGEVRGLSPVRPNDGWYFCEARESPSPTSPLTRHQRVHPVVGGRPDDDRLQHSYFANRRRQGRQAVLVEASSRLGGVGRNAIERNRGEALIGEIGGKKGVQAPDPTHFYVRP